MIKNVEIAPRLFPAWFLVMLIFSAVVGLSIFVYMKASETAPIVDEDDYYL